MVSTRDREKLAQAVSSIRDTSMHNIYSSVIILDPDTGGYGPFLYNHLHIFTLQCPNPESMKPGVILGFNIVES
jgi:hypothetical protein